jgi:hypothetical protein
VKGKLLEVRPEPPIHPDVIARLTEVYGAIERDEIAAVGVAVGYRDGSTDNSYSAPPNYGLLLAAVTRLQHRLLKVGDNE